MSKFVEITASDGTKVFAEVSEAETRDGSISGQRPVGRNENVSRTLDFKKALDNTRPVIDDVINNFAKLSSKPNKIEVQFGLKLSGQVGAVIAKTGTEASFSVKVTWETETPGRAKPTVV